MLNNFCVVGRLVSDPELKYTVQSNIAVLSFTIACQRSHTGKDGKYAADFIDCVAWRNQAEFISKHFGKGDVIALTGRIETRVYRDKNGNNRKAVEAIVSSVDFVPTAKTQPDPPPMPEAPNWMIDNENDDGYLEIDDNDDMPF